MFIIFKEVSFVITEYYDKINELEEKLAKARAAQKGKAKGGHSKH
jgi:hypothetical protein